MNAKLEWIARWAGKVPVLALIAFAFVAGYAFRGAVLDTATTGRVGQPSDQPASDTIWTCSMHPEIRLPQPGECPKCGMELIPAAAEPAPATKRAPKYACSMFCVPPMEKPGQCPICGMEMVEVEETASDREAGPRTLTLSPASQKLAAVAVAPVERKFVSAQIHMVGKVEYDETRVRSITAWVPGRLDRLYADYTGMPVARGHHLVKLYSPELLTAQEELLQVLRSVDELANSDLPSMRASAAANLNATRDRLRLWGLTGEQITEIEHRGTPSDHVIIYSPIGGIVVDKHADEGEYVQTGTRIYTIADLSRVWVKLDAYESDLAWLRYGQAVEFHTEAYPGETFHGTIAFIDPVLNPRTRTVKVRLNVPNEDGRLKPEMFVSAVAHARVARGGRVLDASLAGKWICPMHPEIVKDVPESCDLCGMPLVRAETLGYIAKDPTMTQAPLVVPASAPLITGRRAVVYVEVPGQAGTYEGREIVLGPRAGDYYLVRDGLAEGEQVVVNGNFKIDSAMQIRARASMMNPQADEPATPTGHDHVTEGTAAQPTSEAFEVSSAFETQFDEVIGAYFGVQEALSHDHHVGAVKDANGLLARLETVDAGLLSGLAQSVWLTEREGIKKSATDLAAAADIEAARTAFALLSESMAATVARFGTGGQQPIYRFHCPMAFNNRGADWLQNAKEAENPYFGAAMFRCGVLKETISAQRTNTGNL
jgi:Cu(I)/Ag(I) efflux system membrane fusion protein